MTKPAKTPIEAPVSHKVTLYVTTTSDDLRRLQDRAAKASQSLAQQVARELKLSLVSKVHFNLYPSGGTVSEPAASAPRAPGRPPLTPEVYAAREQQRLQARIQLRTTTNLVARLEELRAPSPHAARHVHSPWQAYGFATRLAYETELYTLERLVADSLERGISPVGRRPAIEAAVRAELAKRPARPWADRRALSAPPIVKV